LFIILHAYRKNKWTIEMQKFDDYSD